ncbi:MAG TPA: phage tail sheath C-terminal domain-containing protein [Allosphingosinicella sp.]|nr:phage tail sheath C-terminal domain-containing protein [Allosphingosinicella sp.]
MPNISYPGVYVEEVPSGGRSIPGVDTTRAAFVGHALKAPAWMEPVRIESLTAFERDLGGPVEGFRLHGALRAFFDHGGKQAIVLPVGPCDGATADPAPLLAGLERIGREAGPNLLLVPDALRLSRDDYHAVVQAMLAQCAQLKDRFAILDVHGGDDSAARSLAGSAPLLAAFRAAIAPLGGARAFGAAYYPWLVDSAGSALPAAPAVAGLVARTDIERGVWKAPAGIEASVRVADVAVRYTDRQQQEVGAPVSEPAINLIRRFAGKGVVVWGARTLAAEGGDWRYVSVRRTAIFIEQSISQGLQWAVFEPNEIQTWQQVRRSVENFMFTLFRQGAFQGMKPQDAYYVACGLGATMSQDDVEGGRLIVEIGFAPMRPAEFVIIRITLTMCAPGG